MLKRFEDLRIKVTPLLKPYAKRISVFGSFARGDETAQSDIDILVALKSAEQRPALGLFTFIQVEQELEKRLGCQVDLVTEEGLSLRVRQNIENEKVVLYEEKG